METTKQEKLSAFQVSKAIKYIFIIIDMGQYIISCLLRTLSLKFQKLKHTLTKKMKIDTKTKPIKCAGLIN